MQLSINMAHSWLLEQRTELNLVCDSAWKVHMRSDGLHDYSCQMASIAFDGFVCLFNSLYLKA